VTSGRRINADQGPLPADGASLINVSNCFHCALRFTRVIDLPQGLLPSVWHDINTRDELSSGVLVLVCPETGGEIDTGVVYCRDDLERVKAAKLVWKCPSCRKQNGFNFSEAKLRTLKMDE
jgi:hypothetical protein